MKRAPLYSRSQRPSRASAAAPSSISSAPAPTEAQAATPPRRGAMRRERWLWALGGALLALSLMLGQAALRPQRVITQKDIDSAVRQSIEKEPLPSPYAKAYETIRPSVVRVVASSSDKDEEDD